MAALRDLLSGCGLDDPRSLLQSGNLIFGSSDSKLTYPVIARHLGVPSTGRNWNTVLKLAAMVA